MVMRLLMACAREPSGAARRLCRCRIRNAAVEVGELETISSFGCLSRSGVFFVPGIIWIRRSPLLQQLDPAASTSCRRNASFDTMQGAKTAEMPVPGPADDARRSHRGPRLEHAKTTWFEYHSIHAQMPRSVIVEHQGREVGALCTLRQQEREAVAATTATIGAAGRRRCEACRPVQPGRRGRTPRGAGVADAVLGVAPAVAVAWAPEGCGRLARRPTLAVNRAEGPIARPATPWCSRRPR